MSITQWFRDFSDHLLKNDGTNSMEIEQGIIYEVVTSTNDFKIDDFIDTLKKEEQNSKIRSGE